jgi:hypothetical protein
MAALYASDGGGADRSCLDAEGGAVVPRAAVATAARAVSRSCTGDREMTGGRCAREEAKRAARGPEISREHRITGRLITRRRRGRGPSQLAA